MDGHVIVPSFAKPFRSRANHATPVTLRPSSSGEKYWLKVKSFEETDFDIVAVGDREAGDGSPGRGGRPVGSAFIILPAGIQDRLWERVQGAKPAGKADNSTQAIKPGIVGRVRHLHGEIPLRDATPAGIGRSSDTNFANPGGSDAPAYSGRRTRLDTVRHQEIWLHRRCPAGLRVRQKS